MLPRSTSPSPPEEETPEETLTPVPPDEVAILSYKHGGSYPLDFRIGYERRGDLWRCVKLDSKSKNISTFKPWSSNPRIQANYYRRVEPNALPNGRLAQTIWEIQSHALWQYLNNRTN